MPYSSEVCKEDVREHFINKISTELKILDVGPGCGTYSFLLRDLGYKMDCLEIFEPYVIDFDLKEKYDNVHIGNVVNFNFSSYDYVIMGDVFEHISFEDAKNVLDRVNLHTIKCMIAVPFDSEQGEHFGNVHEIHLQPDLTFENVPKKYPSLRYLFGDPGYGYYVNY